MTLLETAKGYLSLGWSIIPVKKGTKIPAVEWKKYQNTLPEQKDLRSWFENKTIKDVGIGLVTGKISGVVVVDQDLYKKAGKEVLDTPIKVKTGGGGVHGYYAWDRPIKNQVEINGQAVDIRGDGGYVVLPPTIHPNGTPYTWMIDQNLRIPEALLGIPALPKEYDWIEAVEQKPLNLREHISVPEGSRNDSLYRLACSLLRKHSQNEAYQLIKAANQTYQPPLSDREADTLFKSAVDFIGSQPKAVLPMIVKEEELAELPDPILWEKIQGISKKREWVWEGYLSKGHITLLSALWKSGKSTFVRCLFSAMNKNEEFIGQPTVKNKILVLSEESPEEWEEATEVLDKEEIEGVYIWARPIVIQTQKAWEKLIDQVAKKAEVIEAGVVVIDTLSTFWPVENENDNSGVIRALKPLWELTNRNIAVLLVHHFRKSGGDQALASRGAGALAAYVDEIIEFSRVEDGYPNRRQIKSYGRSSAELPTVAIEFTSEEKYMLLGDAWKVSKQARLDRVVEIIDKEVGPISIRQIVEKWGENISARSVRRYVAELLDGNIIRLAKEEVVGKVKVPFYVVDKNQQGFKEIGDIFTK